MKKYLIMLLVGLMVALGFVVVSGSSAANATDEPCVPSDAWSETIQHNAVTHVVHHEAVPAGPDLWWNWAPNNQSAFDGPPAFPSDDRGVWVGPHENGGPSQDLYGTFQQADGHGPWFHREHGTAAVDAWDETVVDSEAWIEIVEHPAVTCDDGDDPTCEFGVILIGTVLVCYDPTPPTCNVIIDPECNGGIPRDPIIDPCMALMVNGVCPIKNDDETSHASHSVKCVGGALITKDVDKDGNISSSVDSGSKRCPQKDSKGEFFKETGF